MLSRVAESIYWMARYIERAENLARIVNVNANLLLDLPTRMTVGWQPLIDITGSKRLFAKTYDEASERNVVRFLVADTDNPGSLLSSLNLARENARTIRDIIPREGWELINELYLDIKGNVGPGLARKNRFEFLNRIISRTQQMTGLLAGTMLNDQGYDFLRMGRNLERGDMTSRIVDVQSGKLLPKESEDLVPYENAQWMSVLMSLSGYQAYRQKVQGPIRRSQVLRFLLQDVQFPRSFGHCVREVESCLRHLPRNREPLQAIKSVAQTVRRTKLAPLSEKELHRFLDGLQTELGDAHESIQATYFRHG
jgi:uncharacterized alpha-E superfamily protein